MLCESISILLIAVLVSRDLVGSAVALLELLDQLVDVGDWRLEAERGMD